MDDIGEFDTGCATEVHRERMDEEISCDPFMIIRLRLVSIGIDNELFAGTVTAIDLEDYLEVGGCAGPYLKTDSARPNIKMIPEDILPLNAGKQLAIQGYGVVFGKWHRS